MNRLFSSVLVGIDGSDSSFRATRHAIVMARQLGSRLTAVYVVDTATITRLSISRILVETEASHFRESLEHTGRRYLDFVADLARSKGLGLETRLRHGSVATELLAAAEEQGADCLVLGGWDHVRPSFEPLSRAYREILAHATIPVLISCGTLAEEWYKSF
jgi:nucleotide-binding universal stress UspA family protein